MDDKGVSGGEEWGCGEGGVEGVGVVGSDGAGAGCVVVRCLLRDGCLDGIELMLWREGCWSDWRRWSCY